MYYFSLNRARTCDLSVNSRMLHQLSYQRIGPTGIRTPIAGFKVMSTNPYTIGPLVNRLFFTMFD